MNKKGRYGEYGGQYASETLMNALIELEAAFEKYKDDEDFLKELNYYHKQ
ncbi:MAG: tryptophan synthase subunit beta, partial [Candidatus Ornithomonoglobus sp.]